MSRPPQVRPKDLLKALIKLGFRMVHQTGSHVHLRHSDGRITSVSIHSKPIDGPNGGIKVATERFDQITTPKEEDLDFPIRKMYFEKYKDDMDDSYINDQTLIFEVIVAKEISWYYADQDWE